MHYKSSNREGKSTTPAPSLKIDRLGRNRQAKELHSLGTISRSSNLSEFTAIHQPKWFWSKHSHWSYLQKGLFWGIVVSFTAVFSAGCGVALTKIERVEKAISQKIAVNFDTDRHTSKQSLTRPLTILLIEVNREREIQNKNILILKLDPQIGFVRVTNIPTDSRVKLANFGWSTIAEAYRYGGTALISQTVEELMNNVKIDRYLTASSDTLAQLTASGKLILSDCDREIQDCSSTSEVIQRQESEFEEIHQRLNIPAYFDNFAKTINAIQPNLDSNISNTEFIYIANFVREIDKDNVSINFLPKYPNNQGISLN